MVLKCKCKKSLGLVQRFWDFGVRGDFLLGIVGRHDAIGTQMNADKHGFKRILCLEFHLIQLPIRAARSFILLSMT